MPVVLDGVRVEEHGDAARQDGVEGAAASVGVAWGLQAEDGVREDGHELVGVETRGCLEGGGKATTTTMEFFKSVFFRWFAF